MSDDPFYIGYLPKAPPVLAQFTRRATAAAIATGLCLAAAAAITLPYFGSGVFEFGHSREYSGVMRCEVAPLLETSGAEMPLVGFGKHAAPLELCGGNGRTVTLNGTLITRDGRQLVEVADYRLGAAATDHAAARESAPLGRFALTGEIVDAKCYFGVMNPGEGRAHRACAQQCLRGGIPAVFVARDQTGTAVPLLIDDREGGAASLPIIRLAGEVVVASGHVTRQGKWLVLQIESVELAR